MEAAGEQRGREENERSAEEERDTESGGVFAGGCLQPFVLQPSIIDVVAKLCPENEADEIWRVVGHSLVEQAKDLLEEVTKNLRIRGVVMVRINWDHDPPLQASALLEIWRQLKEDADQAASRE